jgi:hypothetical protein
MSMETPDTLRYTKIPLNNGSGAMPAVGFGALIRDPVAWAVQRGTGFLVTSRTASRIQENFDISSLPEDAMREIRHGITTNVRRNPVVETGVPGFIPRAR